MNSEQQQQSTTIIRYFIEEAQEHLQTIEQGVLNLQEVLADVERINELFRAAHSIKGGAAMLSLDGVQHIAHRLEDYFKILKDRSGVVVDEKLKSLFLAGCDRLQELLDYLQEHFTISAELATVKIAEVEPIFSDLESHLNALVALAPESDDTSWREQYAENQAYDRLMVKFQSGVAERLRDMLQLFKQDDNRETRQQLQETCDRLLGLGENLSISGWRELISASKSAIANLANPYLSLAQVIIRDIRQAQDLVLAERSYEISVSEQLSALIQPVELDAFVDTNLEGEDAVSFEEAIGSSDEFFDSFDSASGIAEDVFFLEGETDGLDGGDDFEFDFSESGDLGDVSNIFDDSSKEVNFDWEEAEPNDAAFVNDMSETFPDNEASFDNLLADNDELSDLTDGEFLEVTSGSSLHSYESEDSAFAMDIANSDDMYADESFETDLDTGSEYDLEREFSDPLETDSTSNDFGSSLGLEEKLVLSEVDNLENYLEDESFEVIEDIEPASELEEWGGEQIDPFALDFGLQEGESNDVDPFEDSVSDGLNLPGTEFLDSMDNDLYASEVGIVSSPDLSEERSQDDMHNRDREVDESDRKPLTEDSLSSLEIANTEGEGSSIGQTDSDSESVANLEVVNTAKETSRAADSWNGELLSVADPISMSDSSEDRLTSKLDEELSAALVLDELVELEALGFDLDDADEEDNFSYQGLAASDRMFVVPSTNDSPSATSGIDELVPTINEEQIADFFSSTEEITNTSEDSNINLIANAFPTSEAISEAEASDLGLSDFFAETEEENNEASAQKSLEAVEEEFQAFNTDSSDSSASVAEETQSLADFFNDDTIDRSELELDRQPMPDMEFGNLFENSSDVDLTSNVQADEADLELPDFSDVESTNLNNDLSNYDVDAKLGIAGIEGDEVASESISNSQGGLDFQFDLEIANNEMDDSFATSDIGENPESSLDFDLASDFTSDLAEVDRDLVVEVEDFSDLLAIGEESGFVSSETNDETNAVSEISSGDVAIIQEVFTDRPATGEEYSFVSNETDDETSVVREISSGDATMIQADDSSVLDDLGTFDASSLSLTDEADLLDLFADNSDSVDTNDISANFEQVDEFEGFDLIEGASDQTSGGLEQAKESLDEFSNVSWDFDTVADVPAGEVPAVTEEMEISVSDFDADLQDFSDLLTIGFDRDDSQSDSPMVESETANRDSSESIQEIPQETPSIGSETFNWSEESFHQSQASMPASNIQGISSDSNANLAEVVEGSANFIENSEDTDITETVFLDDAEDLLGFVPEHHDEHHENLPAANIDLEANNPHQEKSDDLLQDVVDLDRVTHAGQDSQPQFEQGHGETPTETRVDDFGELADLGIISGSLSQVVNVTQNETQELKDLLVDDSDRDNLEEQSIFEESSDLPVQHPVDASTELPEFLSNDPDRLVWEEVADGDVTKNQSEEQLGFVTEAETISQNSESVEVFGGERTQINEVISQGEQQFDLESSANLEFEALLGEEGLQDLSEGSVDFDLGVDTAFEDAFQDINASGLSESSDLPADLPNLDVEIGEKIAGSIDFAENNPDLSDLDSIFSDEDSEISEIFGLSDLDFPETDSGSDEDDGGLPKFEDNRPDPSSPSNDGEAISDTFDDERTGVPDSSLDSWEDLDNILRDTSSKMSNLGTQVDGVNNFASVSTNVPMPKPVGDNNPDRSEDFDELEALLASSLLLPSPVATASGIAQIDKSLPDSSFDDLEALLGSPPPKLSMTSGIAQVPKAKKIETDEFDELEMLLRDTYGKEVGTVNTKTAKRQALAKRSVSKIVSQTMKVDVKHLDSLNNLVGELVVNRNLLEQNQERLQLFIGNLLFKVQQLGDVAQRMRDQYDRSLLESSIIASTPRSFSSEVLGGHRSLDSDDTGGAVTATFEDIEFDRYNSFHILSQEIIELVVRVRESASDIEFVVDETEQVGRQLGTITTQVQDDLKQVRMVPFAQIADRLPRAVRDLAFKTGKQAELEIHGRETLIDKAILEQLYDPMTHLVNNAIVHGLEDPGTRQAGGKPASGKITIRAFHQGNQTVISISDDGAGINTEKVKQSAVKKGLYTQSEVKELTDIEAYDLLFEAGFSTKSQADELAGRGVGLDVVRTTLNDIRGSVHTDSSLTKGTTFTIRLPLTLSISKAMFCVCDRTRIAFPVDGFEDMIEVPQNQVQLNDKGQPCLPWRDTILPFQPLSNLLSYNRHINRSSIYGKQDDDVISVIVLRNEGNYLALQVDQFLGESEIVIKQLEGPIPKPVGIAGATILGDGKAMAIVSVLELFDIAAGRLRPSTASLPTQPIENEQLAIDPTVLIVDDSITVRELLSLTFAKVGYRVEQARDGQDAWEKLRAGLPCNLIFCDIEMPRMDGLELLSRLQKDEYLSKIPVAMLTSRGADRHRQSAKQLGAKGYFTKPYLEEELLSASHRLLLGEALV